MSAFARNSEPRLAWVAAGLALATLPGCATLGALPEAICAGAGLAVDTDFAGAGIHDCILAPDGGIVVSVDHEPAVVEGINPSPWYAFRIVSAAAGQRRVTLDYTDYEHRYAPFTSPDGETWTQLGADRVTLNERKSRATLTLDLPAGALFVAGQPLSSASDAIDWTRARLRAHKFAETRYGSSLDGRPLVGFAGGGEKGDDVIVALTRQHPPETTGEEAFRAFLDRLLARDDVAARAFRASHRIVLAPMPNPDGVDGGHWRLNKGGLDLNRDWGGFTQPETQSLSNWILKETAGRRTVAFFDFHSTFKTVMYAPPFDAPSPDIVFLPLLEQRLKDALKAPPEWSYAHSANGGTSKGWAMEALKAPGVTVELWDQIPLEDARALGATVADALIEYATK